MNELTDDIHSALHRIIERVFKQKTGLISPRDTSQDIAGWDSFQYVEVIVELEATYGIEMEGPDLDEVHTIGDLLTLVRKKMRANSVSFE